MRKCLMEMFDECTRKPIIGFHAELYHGPAIYARVLPLLNKSTRDTPIADNCHNFRASIEKTRFSVSVIMYF